jgi:uncharacterized membrane protein
MAKQEIKRKETHIATHDGVGKLSEQSVTVDDNCLPSPQELEAYKLVDPRIIDHLLAASEKEQAFRHKFEIEKIKIIKSVERRSARMNWWGMLFAFLCIASFMAVTAYALYLDRLWLAGIMGGAAIVSIVSIFIRKEPAENELSVKRKK